MIDLPKARSATRLIFLVCGIGISSWAPMVPYVKDRLGLNDGSLSFTPAPGCRCHAAAMALVLFLFGSGIRGMDVAMNSHPGDHHVKTKLC